MSAVVARSVACALLCVVAAGACKNAYRRELVVVFSADATPAMHAAALRACTGVAPNSSPEPIVPSSFSASRISDVRFRIDHANDHDIAQLQACLSKQPGVVGTQDSAANS